MMTTTKVDSAVPTCVPVESDGMTRQKDWKGGKEKKVENETENEPTSTDQKMWVFN